MGSCDNGRASRSPTATSLTEPAGPGSGKPGTPIVNARSRFAGALRLSHHHPPLRQRCLDSTGGTDDVRRCCGLRSGRRDIGGALRSRDPDNRRRPPHNRNRASAPDTSSRGPIGRCGSSRERTAPSVVTPRRYRPSTSTTGCSSRRGRPSPRGCLRRCCGRRRCRHAWCCRKSISRWPGSGSGNRD